MWLFLVSTVSLFVQSAYIYFIPNPYQSSKGRFIVCQPTIVRLSSNHWVKNNVDSSDLSDDGRLTMIAEYRYKPIPVVSMIMHGMTINLLDLGKLSGWYGID